jgi:hypothetical protein
MLIQASERQQGLLKLQASIDVDILPYLKERGFLLH